MLKKIVSVLLVAIVSLVPTVTVSAIYAAEDDMDAAPAEGRIVTDGELSRVVYYDKNGNKTDMSDAPGGFTEDAFTNVEYPEKYDERELGYVTSVKDQGDFGTCWTFSYCSAAETSLIAQGYETKKSVDLSEAHLAFFSTDSRTEGSDRPEDKDVYYNSNLYNAGGSMLFADAALARGSGFVKEEDFPYDEDDADNMMFSSEDKYKCDYQLVYSQTHYNFSVESCKRDLLKYGGVYCSFAASRDDCFTDVGTACFYCPDNEGSDHSVAIIGWDDNYSRDNFGRYKPDKDGAWLCKNSWGRDWGERGYFWLSYYDGTLTDYTAVRAVPAGSYDKIYQYDGIFCSDFISAETDCYMANIFTVENSGESISAAGFSLPMPMCYSAEVSLYTGLVNADNPTYGFLRETKTVQCNSQGYYTVEFSNTYPVDKYEIFSIVVKLISCTDTHLIPAEGKSFGDEEYTVNYSSERFQSFVNLNGCDWKDAKKLGCNNVPVKALMVNNKAVTSLEIGSMPSKTEYYVGNKFSPDGLSLIATLKGGRKMTVTGGFSWDKDEFTTTGNQNVTVTYFGKSVKIPVTVRAVPDDAVRGIFAEDIKINVYGKEAIPVTVEQNGSAGYEIDYYSNNENVAAVDGNGNAVGVSRGQTEIICVVTDEYGNTYTDNCVVTVKYSFGQWLIIILLFGWLWY